MASLDFKQVLGCLCFIFSAAHKLWQAQTKFKLGGSAWLTGAGCASTFHYRSPADSSLVHSLSKHTFVVVCGASTVELGTVMDDFKLASENYICVLIQQINASSFNYYLKKKTSMLKRRWPKSIWYSRFVQHARPEHNSYFEGRLWPDRAHSRTAEQGRTHPWVWLCHSWSLITRTETGDNTNNNCQITLFIRKHFYFIFFSF